MTRTNQIEPWIRRSTPEREALAQEELRRKIAGGVIVAGEMNGGIPTEACNGRCRRHLFIAVSFCDSRDRRANIELTGRITRRYFSRDVLVLQYKEAGLKPESSTIQRLTICSRDALGGCFLTTITNTSGPVRWQRIANRDDMYKPVEQPKGCNGGVDCSAAMTRSL